MRTKTILLALAVLVLLSSAVVYAQTTKRQDVIWARTVPKLSGGGIAPAPMTNRLDLMWAKTVPGGTLTMDGVMNEPAWAVADSVLVTYGEDSGIPGSGWRQEAGAEPSDPTKATVKFLVQGDSLYMGVFCRDSSVGGGLFNQFDGFLMNLRDRTSLNRPVPSFEYFYGWVTEPWADTLTGLRGAKPGFFGWASGDRSVWNAATTVLGESNADTNDAGVFTPDEGWVTEVVFNLNARGYQVSRPEGDLIEFNISVYDADWQWPVQAGKFSGNRAWFQGPWGNGSAFNVIRIYARPDVTIGSGPAPTIGSDLRIPNALNYAAPTIDGQLTEAVWQDAPSFKIKYGDTDLRNSYTGAGPYRSGQYQPTVNGGTATVVDPGDVTVKYFFKDNMLYFGYDVTDGVVQYAESPDRQDAVRLIILDREKRNVDEHVLVPHMLSMYVGASGQGVAADELQAFIDSAWASAALALKPNTTVDTLGAQVDEGYTVELAIDLTKIGYPAGRGDGVAFLGTMLKDGDSFGADASASYGTFTWWYRDNDWNAASAWCYMDPAYTQFVTDVAQDGVIPKEFALLGNYPNPFNPTTKIRYALPEPSAVTIEVYNLLGQSVGLRVVGVEQPGVHEAAFDAGNLGSGVYFYRVTMLSPSSASERATFFGKMMLLK